MGSVEWDYSDRAATYDQRADYSTAAIQQVLDELQLGTNSHVADVGAGTGKLAIPLLKSGFSVSAVEPNLNMRTIGISNTKSWNTVRWIDGTAEDSQLETAAVSAVFFGSSFNVVNQEKALREARRISSASGSFVCMFNHRDLNDPLQYQIESLIRAEIPNYEYGSRRQDPTEALARFGGLGAVHSIEHSFTVMMPQKTIINAWKSHHTLARQAGDKFSPIIDAIAAIIPDGDVVVPYTTRIWYSRFNK